MVYTIGVRGVSTFEHEGVVFLEVVEAPNMVEVTLDWVFNFNLEGDGLMDARYWCKVLLLVETEWGLLWREICEEEPWEMASSLLIFTTSLSSSWFQLVSILILMFIGVLVTLALLKSTLFTPPWIAVSVLSDRTGLLRDSYNRIDFSYSLKVLTGAYAWVGLWGLCLWGESIVLFFLSLLWLVAKEMLFVL